MEHKKRMKDREKEEIKRESSNIISIIRKNEKTKRLKCVGAQKYT